LQGKFSNPYEKAVSSQPAAPLVIRGLQVIWHTVMSEHCNYVRTLPAHMDKRDHEIIYRHILEEQETSYQDRNILNKGPDPVSP